MKRIKSIRHLKRYMMPLLKFLSKLLQCSVDPVCVNEMLIHTKKQAGDQRACMYYPAFSSQHWHSS